MIAIGFDGEAAPRGDDEDIPLRIDHSHGRIVAASAREKLREVDARIEDLLQVRSRLERVVSRGCDSITECSCGECPLDGDLALAPAVAGADAEPDVGFAGSRGSEDSVKAAKA